MESGGDPAAIMDAWSGADRAVLVDAMVSGSAPGTVRRFDATETPLPIAVHLASTHGMGAAEAIELARSLDRLPPRLLVYGIDTVSRRKYTLYFMDLESGEIYDDAIPTTVGSACWSCSYP